MSGDHTSGRELCCTVVASTGGAVMNELLKQPFFKRRIHSVVSDRDCPAIAKARAHGVAATVLAETSAAAFCARLDAYLQAHEVDYVISFFTKLFVGRLLERYRDRIVNLHPSLLPSFKGLHGFEDTVRAGVRYAGSTIHFLDEHMDEGKVIVQTVVPIDPACPLAELRHRIFEQQCRSLLQVVKWLVDGRIVVQDNAVVVRDATYTDFEFSPALDFADAIALRVPRPVGPAGGQPAGARA